MSTSDRSTPRPEPPHRSGIGGSFSVADLERETGVSPRTIRYYISEGLLPAAHGRGPSATYDHRHLVRLRLVALLRESERLGISEIRDRLATLSDEEMVAMLQLRSRPPADRWRRVTLHPGLELHVREPRGEPDLPLEDAVGAIMSAIAPIVARLERTR